MNLKAIFNVVGVLLILLAALLTVPFGVSLYFHTPALEGYLSETHSFLITLVLSLVLGAAFWKIFPSGIEKLRDREGFAIVAFSWIMISLFGALPYYLSGVCPLFIDAFFESMSGFTTTGATILQEIDPLPLGTLFWRNLTQWLGGMGIIMLSLAIFPALGLGGFHLFKAEIPGGATVERVQPRLAETAKILWKVYVVLSLIEVILLRLGGLSYFDAICHTFSTMATGGFSPHTASVAEFNSTYVETVIIIFMFLAGANFALHFQLINRNFEVVYKNPEFRFYFSMVLLSVAVVTWGLWNHSPEEGLETAFRRASFQVISINTTTGYTTDDFNRWPDFLRILMVGIMMVGGCTGSTSGSLKAIRFIILFKIILRELRKLVQPRAIFNVKVGGKTVPPEHLMNSVALTFLFIGLSMLSSILLTFMGLDPTTSLSASIATLFNIGPGLGGVGPAGNYAEIPDMGKGILIACMLMGRLEIYGIMLLFLPLTWRK